MHYAIIFIHVGNVDRIREMEAGNLIYFIYLFYSFTYRLAHDPILVESFLSRVWLLKFNTKLEVFEHNGLNNLLTKCSVLLSYSTNSNPNFSKYGTDDRRVELPLMTS